MCRQYALEALEVAGLEPSACEALATPTVRLLYACAGVQPSCTDISLPGKPGWRLLLAQAARTLARLHTLQCACLCDPATEHPPHLAQQPESVGGRTAALLLLRRPPVPLSEALAAESQPMQAAWRGTSGAPELQLCLSGLQEFFGAAASSPLEPRSNRAGALVRAALGLEAAAAEYDAERGLFLGRYGASCPVESELGGRRCTLREQGERGACDASLALRGAARAPPGALVRAAVQLEALRCLSWLLWLLGAGN